MRRLLILMLVIAVLSGCKTTPPVVQSDSIRVETRIVKEIEYRDTVIYQDVPVEVKQTIAKDSAHLETSLAIADAFVDTLGLHLFLENKDVKIEVEYKYKVITLTRDSISYRDRVTIKEVEAKLTKWQKFLQKMGWAFLGVLVFLIAWKAKKFFIPL